MTFTAVLKRMAKMGFDVQVAFEHNGWVHMYAVRKDSRLMLRNDRGELLVISAMLYGDREYNVMGTLDTVARQFWEAVHRRGTG